jgi:glycerophosphoryl diester phosphodiesterase
VGGANLTRTRPAPWPIGHNGQIGREPAGPGRYGSAVAARHRVLISAHRCGYAELSAAGASARGLENTVEGIAHAAAVGADYVEFDVRRCADGVFVIAHDAAVGPAGDQALIRKLSWAELHARGSGVLALSEFLDALAPTGVGAHVDMKFATPQHDRDAGRLWELDLLEVLVASLDPARIIMTTGNGAATNAMRDWIADRDLPILVGLSIGASLRNLPLREAARSLLGQLFPRHRFEASRADAVAAHYALAMVRLTRWTARIGVPLLIWTVDSPRLQRRLLRDHRVWMITTNWPARAIALRDGARR